MHTAATSLLARLNAHRAWVNDNLLAAADVLTEEQLRREFLIGQGSVWKSLTHMYAAEYVWLAALEGDDDPCCPGDVRGKLPGNQLADGAIQSLPKLRTAWAALQQRWQDYVAGLPDDSLDDPVAKTSLLVPAGARLVVRRAEVVLHVCLHAHYTAAQVVNMLRHLGVATLPQAMLSQLIGQQRPA